MRRVVVGGLLAAVVFAVSGCQDEPETGEIGAGTTNGADAGANGAESNEPNGDDANGSDDTGDGGDDTGNGGDELDPEVADEVEATAEELLDAVDEALETGDISAADGLYLETCGGCYGRFDYYETIYADGGDIEGGRILDREVEARQVPDIDHVVVVVTGTTEAWEVVDGSGTVIDESAEEDHRSAINFKRDGDGWVAMRWD